MADKPISFTGPMIRALLNGTKTQTRRIHFTQNPEFRKICDHGCEHRLVNMCISPSCNRRTVTDAKVHIGDRFWVKEAWRSDRAYDYLSPSQMGGEEPVKYLSDDEIQTWGYSVHLFNAGRYRNARFMPRWASRLTLFVTDVRVERLMNCSHDDAIAEGIEYDEKVCDPVETYAKLWNEINEKRGFPWSSNPWVTVLTFRTILNYGKSQV